MTDQNHPPAHQPSTPQTVVNVHMANTHDATTPAAAPVRAAPPGPPKSARTAWLCLVFGAPLALHRIYLERPCIRWLLVVWFLSWQAFRGPFGGIDIFLFIAVGALFFEAIRLPGWVREYNARTPIASPAPSAAPPNALAPTPSAVSDAQPAASIAKPQDLKTLLLRAAHAGDARLTVTQGVMETGRSFEEVERCLRDMVQAGYVDVDNEPESGVIVYVFPELLGRPRSSASEPSH